MKELTDTQKQRLRRISDVAGMGRNAWSFTDPTLRGLIKRGLVEDLGRRREQMRSAKVSKTGSTVRYGEQWLVTLTSSGMDVLVTD